jgi:hypothetical protein
MKMAQKIKANPKLKRDGADQSKPSMAKAREVGADAGQSVAEKLVGHLANRPSLPNQKK